MLDILIHHLRNPHHLEIQFSNFASFRNTSITLPVKQNYLGKLHLLYNNKPLRALLKFIKNLILFQNNVTGCCLIILVTKIP